MCGPKLQCLNISGTEVTGEEVEELREKFADLKTLDLQYCPNLTDQGFYEIIDISNPLLETLKLEGTDMSMEVANWIKIPRGSH